MRFSLRASQQTRVLLHSRAIAHAPTVPKICAAAPHTKSCGHPARAIHISAPACFTIFTNDETSFCVGLVVRYVNLFQYHHCQVKKTGNWRDYSCYSSAIFRFMEHLESTDHFYHQNLQQTFVWPLNVFIFWIKLFQGYNFSETYEPSIITGTL